MKNTFKIVRRAAVEHPFLAASIVAAGALFKDTIAAPDAGQPPVASLDGETPTAMAQPDARKPPDARGARRPSGE